MTPENRRPVRSRGARWIQATAGYLADLRVRPNQISVASMLAAAVSAVSLVSFCNRGRRSFASGIQLRLLCNLLDGMVAVGHQKQSRLGALYNEFPDRLSDSLPSDTPPGYLGWGGLERCSLRLPLTSAYSVPRSNILKDFRGPMAKQHRMAVLGALSGRGRSWWTIPKVETLGSVL